MLQASGFLGMKNSYSDFIEILKAVQAYTISR